MTGSSAFLSRVRLCAGRGEALSAVAPLLIPDDRKARPGHAHRILWLLFQSDAESIRDFLWRDEGAGRFMILSRRKPADPHRLFEIETKEFSPALSPGDRLKFVLRANPVVTTKSPEAGYIKSEKARGKRVDIVMHALWSIPRADRKLERERIAREAGAAWLSTQGEKAGFWLVEGDGSHLVVDGYAQVPVERRRDRRRPASYSVLDLKGEIEVVDPERFLRKAFLGGHDEAGREIAPGFGAAKAFGNGLMLIRRA